MARAEQVSDGQNANDVEREFRAMNLNHRLAIHDHATEMFGNVNGKLVPRDICARKHGGNEQSKAAFIRTYYNGTLNRRQLDVMDEIFVNPFGLTVDEIAMKLDTTPNAISGRITELRVMGKIEKRGTRKTRSGCSAAVWVAV